MYLQLIKCFGLNTQTGNEALVIRDFELDINERLNLALNQKKPACVFMQEDKHTITLDYYYPHKRSQLCLHATLAAAYVFFNENPSKTFIEFTTSIDQQKIGAQKIDDEIFLIVKVINAPQIKIDKMLVEQLINIDSSNIIDVSISSVGSAKLLVEINQQSLLNEINPNLEKIYQWGQKNSINGCYVYFKLDHGIYVGRNFNHLEPKLEDVATGVAAGALSAHLKQSIQLYQGYNLNNNCLINTKYFADKILIGGLVSEI